MRFLDTNVLVYAACNQDLRKRDIALELIHHAICVNHDAVISMQVVSEFTNVMVGRLNTPAEVMEEWYPYLNPLLAGEVTREMLRNAIDIRKEYGLQYYDSVVIAAAEKFGCHEIITEDLNPGQLYRGMVAVNPF